MQLLWVGINERRLESSRVQRIGLNESPECHSITALNAVEEPRGKIRTGKKVYTYPLKRRKREERGGNSEGENNQPTSQWGMLKCPSHCLLSFSFPVFPLPYFSSSHSYSSHRTFSSSRVVISVTPSILYLGMDIPRETNRL